MHVKEVTLGARQDVHVLYGALATSYVYYVYMMRNFLDEIRRIYEGLGRVLPKASQSKNCQLDSDQA